MKSKNLIDRIKNNEIKTGTIINVFKNEKHIFDMQYNGIDLLYDYDTYGNEWMYNSRYDFFIEKNQGLLDKTERKYLKSIIRPFEVIMIRKLTAMDINYQCISITVKIGKNDSYTTVLPPFEKGTMYKGMEVGRFYTPRELEI